MTQATVRNPFWLSRDEVRDFDRHAIEHYGVPGIVLMENAGRGCAELLMSLNPERKRVVILCGPGNNGGDGSVIARHLDLRGWPVQVVGVEAPGPKVEAPGPKVEGIVRTGWDFSGLPPDARVNHEIIARSGLEVFPISGKNDLWPGARDALTERLLTEECWIVDALFGTGLSRSLAAPFDELVALVNASRNPVFAVDIPSGLDCDTGEPLGPTVRALRTGTFVALKKGFLNPTSRAWTGELHVIDIGAPRRLLEEFRKKPV